MFNSYRLFLVLVHWLGLSLVMTVSSPACAQDALKIEAVAPGIYVHFGVHQLPDPVNQGAIANIGFIVGERCVAVVDTGGNPAEGQALKQAIEQTTSKPICYVINTHVHPDHLYGNSAFKSPNVKYVGHHKLPRALATREGYYLSKAVDQIGVKLFAKDIIVPELLVSTTLKLDLGARELLLTAHPTAHTDNDLSIYDTTTNTLWLSDLLFISHLPVIDGSAKGWLSELNKLEQRSFKIVIPGHGPAINDWPKGMQAEKNYLQTLIKDVRHLQKQGKFLEEAVASIKPAIPNTWVLVDQFHRKNITSVFAELEWEDSQ